MKTIQVALGKGKLFSAGYQEADQLFTQWVGERNAVDCIVFLPSLEHIWG